jgi:hypothetical protein
MPTHRNFRIDRTEGTSAMNTPSARSGATARHRWMGLKVTHLGR